MQTRWQWRFTAVWAAVLAAVVLSLGGRQVAQAAPGDLSGVFPSNNYGLVVFGGGTVNALGVALNQKGCAVKQVWATLAPEGGYTVYVYGAPAVASAAFMEAYGAGIPANTPLLADCKAGTPPIVASGSATATATATAASTITVNVGATSTWQMQLATNSSATPPPSPYGSKRPLLFKLSNGVISSGTSTDPQIEQSVEVISTDTFRNGVDGARIRVNFTQSGIARAIVQLTGTMTQSANGATSMTGTYTMTVEATASNPSGTAPSGTFTLTFTP